MTQVSQDGVINSLVNQKRRIQDVISATNANGASLANVHATIRNVKNAKKINNAIARNHARNAKNAIARNHARNAKNMTVIVIVTSVKTILSSLGTMTCRLRRIHLRATHVRAFTYQVC
jgi:hypothetical protein